MAVNAACPYLRLLTKDSSGLLARNINVLSLQCPHLKATGITAADVVQHLASSSSSVSTASSSSSSSPHSVHTHTHDTTSHASSSAAPTHTIIPPCMNKGKGSLASPCSGTFN